MIFNFDYFICCYHCCCCVFILHNFFLRSTEQCNKRMCSVGVLFLFLLTRFSRCHCFVDEKRKTGSESEKEVMDKFFFFFALLQTLNFPVFRFLLYARSLIAELLQLTSNSNGQTPVRVYELMINKLSPPNEL